ncbi:bis(5'-nucleosyl)-tetraphosphatase (symmetrical) YqeK [Liquorilactobacillus uvarum]|uniref:bis(5'-nucleosyl)-tetraphosphatase (symmetrical) YqeK n=1 Tax=Liquorilactobacillus uvarum TaxID=303240 RepID=UPI00288A1786|nr:bis(5'-nucleosyl)-tetraphosphatase (symmetrical) YqeK [Liquorilactobacillus uvarum]
MFDLKYHKDYFAGSRDELCAKIQQSVSTKRYQHILGVEQAAVQLAQENNVDVEKASIAGLVHDYAKERSTEEFKRVIKKKHLDPDLLKWNNFIWHGVVGAEIIADELKIDDEEILNAVRRHTVGSAVMTQLDKVVYVADFIEKGRVFPDVDFARTIAFNNLDQAVAFETKHTLQYLLAANKTIYPAAIETYNRWVVAVN